MRITNSHDVKEQDRGKNEKERNIPENVHQKHL